MGIWATWGWMAGIDRVALYGGIHYGNATCEWIAGVSSGTGAYGVVVDYSAFCTDTTSAWARIATLLINTRL